MQTRIANSEPIPGYRVCECLGTGGCGEVWKAEAPGGLTKAIKFVYGYHSDKRAAIELKALERIREVRHPFLLSLERIEIVAGQLVIVTELADGSLRERFNECRRTGMHGIPRPELLRFLRDAADALDFMSEQHSLQHLDVKPENLLLLSGHTKVADFGLVKNFRHVTASLMGGLTPLYAAPEVFHGSPSKCSDQYSLAVVYQELLTGLLPFQADSPAELTLLHLNELPDLSSLPEADRPILARALAKDPSKRFGSCAELIEALTQAGSATSAVPGSLSITPPKSVVPTESNDPPFGTEPTPDYKTLVCDRHTPLIGTEPSQNVAIELPPLPEPSSSKLGPIEPATSDPIMHPTLILGIGGTAGYVLRHLRRRIAERHGDISTIPSLGLLLLDTNSQSLSAAMRGNDTSSLDVQQTMELPLRRPQQYRTDSAKYLRWLSRRWLYNIPRSLKTEGLRPLGRLALVDHNREVLSRLRQSITALCEKNAVATTERKLGMRCCSDSLRVYVVASISGGTGGGMVLDLAYAVSAVRDQLGLNDAGVFGILPHFTSSNHRHREVALINAFSWLGEYHHFARPGGRYPGDPSLGLGAAAPGQKPFRHTYLAHLGDNLSDEDLMQATGTVADYIDLDLFTPAGRELEACRDARCELPPVIANQAPLRTFGLSRTSVLQHDMIEDTVAALCRDAVLGWSSRKMPGEVDGTTGAPDQFENDPANGAPGVRIPRNEQHRIADPLPTADSLFQEAQSLFAGAVAADAHAFMKSVVARAASAHDCSWANVIHLTESLLGVPRESQVKYELPERIASRPVAQLVQSAVEQHAERVYATVTRLVDAPGFCLPGAQQLMRTLRERVRNLEHDAHRLLAAARQKRITFLEAAKLNTEAGLSRTASKVCDTMVQYFLRAGDECTTHLTIAIVRGLAAELSQQSDQLVQFGRELEQVGAGFVRPNGADLFPPSDSLFSIRTLVADRWREQRHELVSLVQQRLKSQLTDAAGGLFQFLLSGRVQELTRKLRELAQQVVTEAFGSIDLIGSAVTSKGGSADPLQSALQAATPQFANCGGIKHLVAVVPSSPEARLHVEKLRGGLDHDASLVSAPENAFTLCYEVAGVSLAHVAVSLIHGRRDYIELAQRVHTRNDVEWCPLTGQTRVSVAPEQHSGETDLSGLAASPWTTGPMQAHSPETSPSIP